MNEDFRRKLLDEISRSGVPVEIETTRQLRERNWLAIPKLQFQDASAALHEIDVYASLIRDDEDAHEYFPPGMELVVECKRSSKKPWVFFEDNVEIVFAKDIFHKLRVVADDPQMARWSVSVAPDGEIFAHHHYANDSIPRASAYLEAFRSHGAESDIFSAFRGIWYAQQCVRQWFHSRTESGDGRKRVKLVHGVVVFDGVLALAALDKSGEWAIREVDHVMVRTVDAITQPTSSPLTEDNEVIIDVVHTSYFGEYLKMCAADVDAFCSYLRGRYGADLTRAG